MTRHYHVGSNMPGYVGDVYTVDTKAAARAAVAYGVRQYRESEWDLPRSQRRTASGSARDAYGLGYVYWWSGPCVETDCNQAGDDE